MEEACGAEVQFIDIAPEDLTSDQCTWTSLAFDSHVSEVQRLSQGDPERLPAKQKHPDPEIDCDRIVPDDRLLCLHRSWG
jgi:hypothetical protein